MINNSRPVFGMRFSTAGYDEILEATCGPQQELGSGVKMLVTANLDHVVSLWRNKVFRCAYSTAWLATIDGAPVLAYARLRGARVPGRVTGADLLPRLMDRLTPDNHRPYFVISRDESRDFIIQHLVNRGFGRDQVCFVVPQFGFEKDHQVCQALASSIREHGTTHLIFGVGSPKTELWIDAHREALGDLYAFGFGAALDFFAGTQRRAPRIFRRFGFEWLWRVACEPQRLSKRYFVDSWFFLLAIFDDLRFKGHLSASAAGHASNT